MELTGAWRPRAALDLRASYTFLDTEVLGVDGLDDEAPAPYRVGDPLLRRPRHQGAINGRLTGSRIGGFAEWAIQGERLDAEPAFGPAGGFYNNEGYRVVNAGASVRALGKAELFGRISNMFAADYEEAFGFPAPGRLLFLGIRIAAGR